MADEGSGCHGQTDRESLHLWLAVSHRLVSLQPRACFQAEQQIIQTCLVAWSRIQEPEEFNCRVHAMLAAHRLSKLDLSESARASPFFLQDFAPLSFVRGLHAQLIPAGTC